MKGELYHVAHPRHTYIRWAIFYTVALAVSFGIFFVVANRIRTYQIPAGSLQLTIPYKKYLVGESIRFTLTNNYDSTVYVEDECPKEPLIVYRRNGNDWVRVHDTATQEQCSNQQRRISLAPHSQQTASFDAWPHLFSTPGTYRVVAYVDYFDTAPYQDFEVITKPEKPAPASAAAPAPAKTTVTATTTQTVTTTSGGTAQTPAPAPSPSTQTITISSGSIAVQYTSSFITVLSVTPAAGCNYEGGQSGSTVEVQFNCGQSQTTLKLYLSGGTLKWFTEH